MTGRSNRIPFEFKMERAAFERSLNGMMRALLDRKRADLMPAENVQAYHHGESWRTHASYEPDKISSMSRHEHEIAIKIDDIIENKLSLFPEQCQELVEKMQASFMSTMYKMLDETCKASGNTVDAKQAGSHAAAFLEMLKKIEFGVDREGRPTLPTIHASPEGVDAILANLKAQGPEFEKEVERIKAEKIAEALEREKSRLARFGSADQEP